MYSMAEEVLLFQQHHNEAETMGEVLRLAAIEEPIGTDPYGDFCAAWSFEDGSRLYSDGDVFYSMEDSMYNVTVENDLGEVAEGVYDFEELEIGQRVKVKLHTREPQYAYGVCIMFHPRQA